MSVQSDDMWEKFSAKVWSKLIALIVIVLFVVGFKELILTDDNVSTAFGGLMGNLPFAKQITDIIGKYLKYQIKVPPITPVKFIDDVLKLAIMALIQPLATRFLSFLFLRVPAGTIDEREKYMDGFTYKVKEMIINIISAPVIAVLAAYITSAISTQITAHFKDIYATILGIISVIIMTGISVIPLLLSGIAFGTALLWRIVITILSKMAITTITNALCLFIYIAITNDMHSEAVGCIFALIVWLIITDVGISFLKRSIASYNVK